MLEAGVLMMIRREGSRPGSTAQMSWSKAVPVCACRTTFALSLAWAALTTPAPDCLPTRIVGTAPVPLLPLTSFHSGLSWTAGGRRR